MLKLILSRVIQSLVTLFALVSVVFVLVRLKPGNPFQDEKAVPEHVLEVMKAKHGFDKSDFEQYLYYWSNVITDFDLGPCIKIYQGYSVGELIAQSFPYSFALGVIALSYALVLGIPLGVLAALKKNSWIDYGSMLLVMLGICVPVFVSGPLYQVFIASNVPFLKVAGYEGLGDMMIPALILGSSGAAYVARLTRGGMLEVLSQDYVRTAKAKGLPMFDIITRHCLRGALMPVVSFLGPAFAGITTGSFVVESVFQIPGMGQHFVKAVTGNEIFIIQGLSLFYGVLIMGANLASDLIQIWMNPQLRKDLGA